MVRSGLAKVASGWTGSITVTVASVDAVVVPDARTSAAELLAALRAACERTHGGTWDVYVGEDSVGVVGVVGLSSSLTFTLAITGTTAARLDWAAASSVTSVTGAVVHFGAYYPAHGLNWGTGGAPDALGSPSSDGANAGSPRQTTGSRSLVAWDTYEASWAAEADIAGVYDVWSVSTLTTGPAPRVHARVRVGSWSRAPLGRLASNVTLTADATEVA